MKHVWVLASPLILAVTSLGATPAQPVHAVEPTSGTTTASALTSVAGSLPGSIPGSVSALPTHGFYWQLTAPQVVLPGTVLVPRGAHKGSRGTRSDDEFFKISRTGSNDVPEAALRAYHRAEKVMATADADCQISWTLLAAIGRVESNHGRFGGSELGADGVSRPEIRGPQLNGAGAFAAIPDSDDGAMDHDKAWDRAVGQMQFLPETWRAVARDGDGDGRMSPHDLDDSALASAVYLCGAGGSLANQAGMARAAFRYNHSDYYVQLVLSFQSGYQTGVFAVPSPPPPPARKAAPVRKPAANRNATDKPKKQVTRKPVAAKPSTPPRPTPVSKPTPKPVPKPAPKPKPTPKPSPSPSPSAPKLTQADGTWKVCGSQFCLDGTELDLGPHQIWATKADADFDGDGNVETNGQEFMGLVGQRVTLQGVQSQGPYVVYVIGGKGYRNADGSYARAQVTNAEPTP